MYNLVFEKDVCGLVMVVMLCGEVGYDIIVLVFEVLCNLEYCGVIGFDVGIGDGVGILIQMFDDFF